MRQFFCTLSAIPVFLSIQLDAQITAELAISEGGVSKGSIVLELDHVKAPRATANFIGLATGEFAWVDALTGAVRKEPYYDGVIFHRVIAGFMNQTGTQNGDGTEGPGYVFADGDELSNGLDHSEAFVVSMANSGVNSNGSQIFITAVPRPGLDGIHIVFGKVTAEESQALITYINNVPVVDNLPVTEVKIDSVIVNFNGVSFDIHAQGLPIVEAPEFTVAHEVSSVKLNLNQDKSSMTRYKYSVDLLSWSYGGEIYKDENDAVNSEIDVTSAAAGKQKMFFNASKVSYDPAKVLWPSSIIGKTLEISTIYGQMAFTYISESSGSFALIQPSGNLEGIFSSYDISEDGFGMSKYLVTSLLSTATGNSLHYRLRAGHDSVSSELFSGRFSGARIFYNEIDGVVSSNPTSGAMTLTR